MFKEDQVTPEEYYIVNETLDHYRVQRICESSITNVIKLIVLAKDARSNTRILGPEDKALLNGLRCPHDRVFIQDHIEQLANFEVFSRRILEANLTRSAITAIDRNTSFEVEGFNNY